MVDGLVVVVVVTIVRAGPFTVGVRHELVVDVFGVQEAVVVVAVAGNRRDLITT